MLLTYIVELQNMQPHTFIQFKGQWSLLLKITVVYSTRHENIAIAYRNFNMCSL
jgi:hypothetical protein